MDFPKIEQKILKFWKENKIFEKSTSQRKKQKRFVFLEGPPYANGKPGIHHLLARAFKDIILRYKTMRGFLVERKAGWDTHGLPTEIAAEKTLGIKTKKDIEKIGIGKFISVCRKNVFTYKKEWEKFTERIGYWLDLKHPYVTCDNHYIESLWWIIKQFWQKGLLYQSKRVIPWCPRCQTSLSSHEIAQGYKKIKEPAIYVKFRVKHSKICHLKPNTCLLIWTTTPWTLPGNVAVAINPELDYVLLRRNKEFFVVAEGRVKQVFKNKDYQIIKKFKGKNLIGLKYKPLYQTANFYEVLPASFVSLEEGTGLVHIAPAFGGDDYELCKSQKIIKEAEIPIPVTEDGKMKKGIIGEGKFIKEADKLIIGDLKKRNLLFKEERYEHDYPFCWRCETPLMYYLHSSWFVETTKIKNDLIKNNQKINWIPSYLKEGRFGKWLEELKDWNFSRERYWGTPLPIWRCQKCQEIKVIGSVKELEKLSGKKIKDLHRPYVDKVNLKCEKCGGVMKRTLEVVDVWFDSGSMPYAQWHYPFENRNFIDKKIFFPANFICEGIDQTRGWFYTLLAVSTLLKFGPPYKNVIVTGIVLDKKGHKMSKSKGNIVEPFEIAEKYGVDAVRWYFYTINQPAEPKLFSEKDIEINLKKFLMTYWNCYSFFQTYVIDKRPLKSYYSIKSRNILDRWILSKLNELILGVTESLEKFDVVLAARTLENFVINDLSLWYIRRSRKRFQRPKNKKELKEASRTLEYVLLILSKLTAPFVPFLSEEIYRCLTYGVKQSVHLEDWPRANEKLINRPLEQQMDLVRQIVSLGLRARAEAKIKVRQPIASLKIKNRASKRNEVGEENEVLFDNQKSKIKDNKELLQLIKDEVNVKEIIFDPKIKEEIELDTKITKELKEEGQLRELIRHIQGLRKKESLTPKDKIVIYYQGEKSLESILEKNKGNILKDTKAKDIKKGFPKKELFLEKKEIKIDQAHLTLAIKKI
ncbi:isoleucine--tRNA ligase [bacterium]|nr:isoleucine--tRNA ligase [bacterium]